MQRVDIQASPPFTNPRSLLTYLFDHRHHPTTTCLPQQSPDIILASGTKTVTNARLVPASDGATLAAFTGGAAVPDTTYITYVGGNGTASVLLAVHHAPFKLNMYVAGTGTAPAISVGERGLVYFEHRRSKEGGDASAKSAAAAGERTHVDRKVLSWGEDGKAIYEGEDAESEEEREDAAAAAAAVAPGGTDVDTEFGLWTETFSSHTDSKPLGPTSLGFDATFPSASHVYGIPEHASSLALKATVPSGGPGGTTEYSEPYRLYNLDVFEYELDNSMALYGSIPFMIAHGANGASAGVFWHNPSETYVDILKHAAPGGRGGVSTRWMSESGVWDLSLIPGPTGKGVISAYTSLTGTQTLPPLFALGYHQCRWNYKDEPDVYAVDAKFEEHAFPYDVLWLDIEHTDGKRYFTWDAALFPTPAAMQNKLAVRGHKMVTIIDPHIKKDGAYSVHKEAAERGYYVRNAADGEYDGWCWPGSSGYLDFTSPVVRNWWAGQFALDKYAGSTTSLYTWNDMNEPSVFNGPEVSMHKDARSLAGVEHREWHNLYGFYQQMASAAGQVARSEGANARAFVLSRAFFAGSQRHGAIWTGDNDAKWEHLAAAAPMLLTIGAAGLTFSGADVGGFFHNPTTELMRWWYQAGSWQPFFRAHAHIETARREPWLFGDETLGALRSIVRTRYTYLPFWYTLFAEAAATGLPVMRPLWLEYPMDTAVFSMDDQWLVGSDILVKPIIVAGAVHVDVYFPGSAPWYDVVTGGKVPGGSGIVQVDAPLSKIPVFQRGGSIVPQQTRPRRAASLMAADPYTLVVALDGLGRAEGKLYLDDGATLDYAKKSLFRLRSFSFAPGADGRSSYVMRSTLIGGSKLYAPDNAIERIVVMGLGRAPVAVLDTESKRALEFEYDATKDAVTIRKPGVKVAYDWAVELTV